MNLERMVKYFCDILPMDVISYVAETGELKPRVEPEKVEDKYINMTIQHVPTFRRNQMRLTREEREEIDRIIDHYERKATRASEVCAYGW